MTSHMWGVIRLIRWARVTHICVSKLTITGSDNGLPSRRNQAMICTSAGIMLFGPLGTNFSEISIEMYTFLFKKMFLKMSSVKLWPFCLRLNVLMWEVFPYHAITARVASKTLQWRHNGRDSVSNHQPHDCLLNLLFRRRPKKTSRLCVTGKNSQLRVKCFHLMTSSWHIREQNNQ